MRLRLSDASCTLAAALLCLSSLAGCAGDGPPPAATSSAYDAIQQQIFNVHCLAAGCHNSVSQAGTLVLEAGVSYGNLVNVVPDNPSARQEGLLRVVPFDPSQSFLVIKLQGPPPDQGSRMPQGQAPLSSAQIDQITNWILAGAPPPAGPTATATVSPSATVTPTATLVPTETPTATVTASPTITSTPTPSPTGTPVATATPTNTPPPTATASATASPTATQLARFQDIQRTIFNPNCLTLGCHDSLTRAGNLVLEADQSYANLVNVQPDNPVARAAGLLRVDPFTPSNSFLVRKLEGPPPDEGTRMPSGQPPLPAAQIDEIRAWILGGALND
jgi:hypothetical protein